jgi:hypothetical protein
VDGEYLRPGDRLDEILPAAYVEKLLANGQATTTPPGEPEPTPALPELPPYPEPPRMAGPGAWLAPDLGGLWPHRGRHFEPGARLDGVDAETVERMLAEGRATRSKPKTEGRSWRVSTLSGQLPDGTPTAPPVAYGRREIEGVRRA